MKQGWQIKKLGDLYPLKTGKTPSRGDTSLWDTKKVSNNLWVSIADISANEGKVITDTKEYITDKACDKFPIVPEGALLLSFKLSLGRMSFAGKALRTNEAILSLVPINEINHRFLYYYFLFFDWDKAAEGDVKVKGKTLNQKKLAEIPIPVPPLSEQQHIVSLLDAEFAKIDTLKANAERNLQNAKDLFQAALKKELEPKEGWVYKRLNDIYDVRDGTHDSPKYVVEGYPFVTSKNLIDGKIDMTNVKYISKEDYDKINERSKVDKGDVLFAMIGSNLGHPALVEEEPNYAIKNVALFKVPSEQSSRLLLYILSSDKVMGVMNKEKNGSSQPFVSLKYLRNFMVSVPKTKEEQEHLADKIQCLYERNMALQTNYEKTIALCDDLKQALLRSVFGDDPVAIGTDAPVRP